MLNPVQLPFGKTINQTKAGHSITTDSAFLIKTIFTQISEQEIDVLELGSGNGIVSIMLSHYFPKWKITGIEIQQHLVHLSRDNALLSKTSPSFIAADLCEFTANKKCDLIVSNPPYFPKNEGRISPIKERAISRHEIACDLFSIMNCIKRNLKFGGRGFILYPQSREKHLVKFAKKVDLKVENKFILDSEKNKERVILELVHA